MSLDARGACFGEKNPRTLPLVKGLQGLSHTHYNVSCRGSPGSVVLTLFTMMNKVVRASSDFSAKSKYPTSALDNNDRELDEVSTRPVLANG